MNAATLNLRPDHPVGQWRGAAMSLLAHVLLLAGLAAMLNWHSEEGLPVQAEIWAAVPQAAAPKAEEDPPPPPAERVKPQPPQRDLAAEQAQRDAEIAVQREREKKRKAEEREREEKLKKAEKDKLAKLEAEKAEKLKKDKADKAEKDKRDAEKRDQAAEDARRDKARQDQLKRIQGMAGASGGAQATGTALQSGGPTAGYGGRIKARVRPNIVFTEEVVGNPVAEVEVRCASDGLILSSKLLKSSGNAAYDRAVLRALEKTERLPRDTDGRVPPVMVLEFKPNE